MNIITWMKMVYNNGYNIFYNIHSKDNRMHISNGRVTSIEFKFKYYGIIFINNNKENYHLWFHDYISNNVISDGMISKHNSMYEIADRIFDKNKRG